MIRRPPISTPLYSSAASDVYKRQMRVHIFPVVFALLAATGMRIGEALALDRDTVDLDDGVLLISRGKGGDPRLVPLHPSVTAALERYTRWRDEHHLGDHG